jgi:hypothetical protein
MLCPYCKNRKNDERTPGYAIFFCEHCRIRILAFVHTTAIDVLDILIGTPIVESSIVFQFHNKEVLESEEDVCP